MTDTPRLESKLEAFFVNHVRSTLGGTVLKLVPTQRGTPDRLVLLPGGTMHLVELKTELGRTSAAQRVWHEAAKRLGITVYTLYGEVQVRAWVRDRANDLSGHTTTRNRK